MIRHLIIGGLLLGLGGSLLLAKQGMVRTHDGRSIEGDVTDQGADGVTIKTRVGTITLNRADVASIEYARSVQELYEQRLAALPANASPRAHMDLARWLYDNKEYKLAQTELDKVLAADPTHKDAQLLRQMVERSMLWEMGRMNPSATIPTPAGPQTTPAAAAARDRNLLTADQVNIIRQHELRDTDRVRVRLDRNVARVFAESQPDFSVADFARIPDQAKAMLILQRGTKEMREDVKILSDPQPIAEFKARVQPVLLTGCATANCHGGPNAGTFRLYGPADNDAVTYTNFYILTQYAAKAGDREYRTISRTVPKSSLVLEYGLPREVAELGHPEAAGWTPAFRSASDPRYLQVFQWLRNSLSAIEPNYGIDYTLPNQNRPNPQHEPQPAPPAPQPTAQQQPEPEPQQPVQQPQPRREGGGVNDALKEARERIRPTGLR